MTFETSAFSVCAVFAGWMGKVPLAAYQIILVIGQLGFCIYYSIGMAIAVLVANESGMKSLKGCRRVAFDGYAVFRGYRHDCLHRFFTTTNGHIHNR